MQKGLFFFCKKAYNTFAIAVWWAPLGLIFCGNTYSDNIVAKNIDFIAKDDKNAGKQILCLSFKDEAHFSLVADEKQSAGIAVRTYAGYRCDSTQPWTFAEQALRRKL